MPEGETSEIRRDMLTCTQGLLADEKMSSLQTHLEQNSPPLTCKLPGWKILVRFPCSQPVSVCTGSWSSAPDNDEWITP